jgi:hypothetical protein
VDRIVEHLKLTFVAAKPPPSHVFSIPAFSLVRFWTMPRVRVVGIDECLKDLEDLV